MKDVSKPVAVFSSKKAIRDYNKKVMGFSEMQNRLRKYDASGNPIDKLTGMPATPVMTAQAQPTLDSIMRSSGQPSTYASKAAYARSMGMGDYYGAAHQDEHLAQVMTARGQQDAMNKQGEVENQRADKEFGLKEKEMAIKEQQAQPQEKPEAPKVPTAEEIADSLLKKYKNQ